MFIVFCLYQPGITKWNNMPIFFACYSNAFFAFRVSFQAIWVVNSVSKMANSYVWVTGEVTNFRWCRYTVTVFSFIRWEKVAKAAGEHCSTPLTKHFYQFHFNTISHAISVQWQGSLPTNEIWWLIIILIVCLFTVLHCDQVTQIRNSWILFCVFLSIYWKHMIEHTRRHRNTHKPQRRFPVCIPWILIFVITEP